MKIAMTKDMIRAMARPAWRSRTMAMATMRGPAAPKPCRTRPASIMVVKSCGEGADESADNEEPMPAYIAGLRPVLSEIGP